MNVLTYPLCYNDWTRGGGGGSEVEAEGGDKGR